MSANSINHSPARATLPSIAQGYEHKQHQPQPCKGDITQHSLGYENTTTPQHSPERATLYSIVREGYEHENMNMPV